MVWINLHCEADKMWDQGARVCNIVSNIPINVLIIEVKIIMEFVPVEKKGREVVTMFKRENKANALSHQVKNELAEAARRTENDFKTSN